MAKNKKQQAFIRWQCRLRQMIVREREGKPDFSIMPSLSLVGSKEPLGHIVTLMNKSQQYSHLPEMLQIAKHTHDPQIRQEKALKLLCEYYYTRSEQFSDILTATFVESSQGAKQILKADNVKLEFEAYGQQFSLFCQTKNFLKSHYYYKATWWHNHLFNPKLSKDVSVVGFIPDWKKSSSTPSIAA